LHAVAGGEVALAVVAVAGGPALAVGEGFQFVGPAVFGAVGEVS
jgi:hypothetical protein